MKRFICEWLSFFLLCIARFCDSLAFDLSLRADRAIAKGRAMQGKPPLPAKPASDLGDRTRGVLEAGFPQLVIKDVRSNSTVRIGDGHRPASGKR